VYLQLVKDTHR